MTTAADYVGLGPCVHDPLWGKMSSPSATLTTKKRRKSESRPQNQLSKCLNEKRRREQENVYVDELNDLLQASHAPDTTSPAIKLDKCATLQYTVKEIEKINCSEDVIQQKEVSSSKPGISGHHIIQDFLEAADGFACQVSRDGTIELVSDNVIQYIKFTSEELIGTSIYTILHDADHGRYNAALRPAGVDYSDSDSSFDAHNKNQSFICRLLVKPCDEDFLNDKIYHGIAYEHMRLTIWLSSQPPNSKSDKCSNVQESFCFIAHRNTLLDPLNLPVEQFTTKLNLHGNITSVDVNGLLPKYAEVFKDFKHKRFVDICHPSDTNKLHAHLKEVLATDLPIQVSFRLKFGPDKFFNVDCKSRYFKGLSLEDGYIMATHTIDEAESMSSCSSVLDKMTAMSFNRNSFLDNCPDNALNTDSKRHEMITSNRDEMLRELLSTNNSSVSIHRTPSTGNADSLFQDIKEEKPKQEFGTPQSYCSNSLSSTIIASVSTSAGSVPSPSRSTMSGHPSVLPVGVSMAHSSDISQGNLPASNMLRGIKRNSEDGHDGNSNKLPRVHNPGSFEALLVTSSPSNSPVLGQPGTPHNQPATPHGRPTTPHGRPATPHGRPTTPLGRATTPHGGPATPLGRSTTPHSGPLTPIGGPTTPLTGPPTPHVNHPLSSPSTVMNQQQPSFVEHPKHEKDKTLRTLLSSAVDEDLNSLSGSAKLADPSGLPQDKLPKDLAEKVNGTINSNNSALKDQANNSILTQLLSGGPQQFHYKSIPQAAQYQGVSSQSQVSSHSMTPLHQSPTLVQSPRGNISQNPLSVELDNLNSPNVMVSINRTFSSRTSEPINTNPCNTGVLSSSYSSNTLPPFSETMPSHLRSVSTSSFPDGALPSLMTATAAFAPQQTNSSDDDPCNIVDVLLELTDTTSDHIHNKSVAEIRNCLMSTDKEAQQALTSAPEDSYQNVMPTSSIGIGPPPYSTTNPRFSAAAVSPAMGTSHAGPGGNQLGGSSVMRPTTPQFSPNNTRMIQRATLVQQRMQHDKMLKNHSLESQDQQVILPSSTSDVGHSPQSSYSYDDLIANQSMGNVGASIQQQQQRPMADSQSSPNYNMMNSPLSMTGQISPSQRVSQPSFSPLGSVGSPIASNQQFTNGLAGSQHMGPYQVSSQQMSPRISQGSPAPPNYPVSGPNLPQVSPTGANNPVQSQAWSTVGAQQRTNLQMQNPILNSQLSTMNNSGNYPGVGMAGAGRGHPPQLRAATARQQSYSGMAQAPSGRTDFSQAQQVMYQSQASQPGQKPATIQQLHFQQRMAAVSAGRPMGGGDGNKWPDINQQHTAGLGAMSPRIDDMRSSSSGASGSESSVLQRLLSTDSH